MSIIEKISQLPYVVTEKFATVASPLDEPGLLKFNWYNKVFYSYNKFRRAHVEVLDMKDRRMWIMHVTIFPHVDDDAPIFGFDVVCTDNKVSGVFHDFTPTTNLNHPLQKLFEENVRKLKWKKERTLPDWGKAIFSEDMVAVGNVVADDELQQIIDMCISNLTLYLTHIGTYPTSKVLGIQAAQNRYCSYQKQNPYPVKMLTHFGLTRAEAEDFVHNHLFPEIPDK
jgi:hypothetical protein